MKKAKIKQYSKLEESINILSHKIGIIVSIIALLLLTVKAAKTGDVVKIISSITFGSTLIALYTASTLYHSEKDEKRRLKLKVFDHSAIYLLIAGTYTPFTLVVLNSKVGWIVFASCWSFGLIGITLKLFFTGRFSIISTIMYVFMGWMIIFAINPLLDTLSSGGLTWLFAGGVSYTVGAVLYSISKIKMNHAMFHILALIGSICHIWAVYFYVL